MGEDKAAVRLRGKVAALNSLEFTSSPGNTRRPRRLAHNLLTHPSEALSTEMSRPTDSTLGPVFQERGGTPVRTRQTVKASILLIVVGALLIAPAVVLAQQAPPPAAPSEAPAAAQPPPPPP